MAAKKNFSNLLKLLTRNKLQKAFDIKNANHYYIHNVDGCETNDRKMAMIKEQHTITISPQIWKILQKLSQIQTKSVSELLEESVQELLKSRRYNAAYLKIMASVEPCEDKENDELTHLLDKLTDDDLEIVEKYPL